MSYEIPQELEYKEKIIFGLTFSQLLYLIIFSPIAYAIFFKTSLNLYIRIFLALIPIILCILFMFTSFLKFIRSWWKWLFFREAKLMDKKMIDFLEIKNVSNYLELKSKRIALIRVEPINYNIKNKEEKDSIISCFRKFINSLEFPVQIVMSTDNLNLDNYINIQRKRAEETIRKTNNEIYLKQFSDYEKHLKNIISESSILNRYFYLVIPENHVGLDIQVEICKELLKNLDLKYELIKNDDLTNVLSGFFNDLLEDDDKTELLKEQDKNLYHSLISPRSLVNYNDYIKVNDKFTRTIAVKGYPRTVEAGFLDKIITTNGDFDFSIHIEPFPIETMLVNLNKELQKQKADLYAMELKGIINPSLDIKYKDTFSVLNELQKGNEKLFNLSLYINCKGKNKKELDLLTKKIESDLNSLMLIPEIPKFQMHYGLKSSIPFADNKLNIKRNITTGALSAFFPFTSQFLQVDESGTWMGNNKNNIPVIKDIFKFFNPNGCILASSGGGKSYFTKLFISRQLLNGTKVMVIDPQSEYINLVKRYNGQLIEISRTSETIINPLDLMGHDYAEKRLTLIDLFSIMLGGTSEIQKSVLDRALTAVYEKRGITNDQKTWNNKPPVLADLLEELERMSKKCTLIEKETYRSLINRLSMYVTGVFSFLNKQTNINFNNQFVCFNIGDMPKQVKPLVMFLILDYIYMKMRKDIERKLLVIDEAWSLLGKAEEDSYIFEIVKTCRKFNLGLLLITQDVADLLKSNAGNALLSNSSYTLLLRQKPAVINDIAKTFQLSNHEREKLISASVGEGILLMENEHSEIKIIASPEEHKIITTRPDEILQNNVAETEQKEVNIKVDEDKGFFKKSELNLDEINYLITKGYKVSSHVSLNGGVRHDYLLKPRFNESTSHFFLVKAIESQLRNYTDKIWLYETKEPDIVFELNNEKIAVEIETGFKLDNCIGEFKIKVNYLNKKYKKWFFVVTKRDYKKQYEAFGTTYLRTEIPQIMKKLFEGNSCGGIVKGDENGLNSENKA